MFTAYHVVHDPLSVGLTMRKMSAEEDKLYSSCPLQEQDVNYLQTDIYGQVDACEPVVCFVSCKLHEVQ